MTLKQIHTAAVLTWLATSPTAPATEFHVAISGSHLNPGTRAKPLRTIQCAAEKAQPGDVITVHEGVYRERITPRVGGTSDKRRIVYRAAPGERVEIKGSEVITNWVKVQDDVWKVTLPNSFFGRFNPYSDLVQGDWFDSQGRDHHTGAVYLNGEWLDEAAKLDEVLKPIAATPLWFGQVDQENTTLWAQFEGVNPNEQRVEINVRQTVFYPGKPGVNYITVRGFIMRQAATPWAPPTVEQIGLVGTGWSKGWIIEDNTISYSKCSGIALGKYGDASDKGSGSAKGYVGTINRALTNGWNKQTVGSHIVRNNEISHCEQTGIVGSLGCSFSTITGNTIHDIQVRRLFSGAEVAGIKFHGPIDVEIRGNHIYRTIRGIWLDWMAQGARVSGNLCHDNVEHDLFLEVNHGPFVVDNNIFLSPKSLLSDSQGGAYAHNLFGGLVEINTALDGRKTPFHKAHSTEIAGLHDNPSGDESYYNNVFVGQSGLNAYDTAILPVRMSGNVFLNGAKASKYELAPFVQSSLAAPVRLLETPDGFSLALTLDKMWNAGPPRSLVTAKLLGKTAISGLPFENADGSPIRFVTDYSGKKRSSTHPFPGPFELSKNGTQTLKVWSTSKPRQ